MNATDYIVVIDGQFRFPVLKANVERVGKTEADVRAMDGESYGAWCMDVPMDKSRGAVGSQGCIDFCEELIEAGADVWEIA